MQTSEAFEKKELDRFELALLEKKSELEECQKSSNLNSCFVCQKTIGCKLRLSYVDSVYKSMNKEKGGGFEF
ncbi:MAG: hypothetical protein QG567_821 [Campylobacterota bacterium]|nr:hypothetical protein [Campylobacterota bacterium]